LSWCIGAEFDEGKQSLIVARNGPLVVDDVGFGHSLRSNGVGWRTSERIARPDVQHARQFASIADAERGNIEVVHVRTAGCSISRASSAGMLNEEGKLDPVGE